MTPYVYWALGVLVVTYGISVSAVPPSVVLRLSLGARSATLLALLYCPVCTGFWVALAASYFFPEPDNVWRFLQAPLFFTGALLLLRGAFPALLTMPEAQLDAELNTIGVLQTARSKRPR